MKHTRDLCGKKPFDVCGAPLVLHNNGKIPPNIGQLRMAMMS